MIDGNNFLFPDPEFDYAIRFAKEKVTLNINLSYTDTRGAMVN